MKQLLKILIPPSGLILGLCMLIFLMNYGCENQEADRWAYESVSEKAREFQQTKDLFNKHMEDGKIVMKEWREIYKMHKRLKALNMVNEY